MGMLVIDLETARHFGANKASLRALGRLIPENDFWIAASAVRYGLPLVTRDAHFSDVPVLRVERW